MTNKTIQVLLLVIAAVTLFGGAFGVIAVVARYTGSIETKIEETGKDIAEIKTTLDKIAPPTVRHAAAPVPAPASAQEATTQGKAAEQGRTAEQGALPDSAESSTADWHSRYLADHCSLCPSCCAKAAEGEP